jgi:hypothetical protein
VRERKSDCVCSLPCWQPAATCVAVIFTAHTMRLWLSWAAVLSCAAHIVQWACVEAARSGQLLSGISTTGPSRAETTMA